MFSCLDLPRELESWVICMELAGLMADRNSLACRDNAHIELPICPLYTHDSLIRIRDPYVFSTAHPLTERMREILVVIVVIAVHKKRMCQRHPGCHAL